jgi:thermostable 8-oxoguanine DNA glycosylase
MRRKRTQREIIPGVPLGCSEDVFSPAFWREMALCSENGHFGSLELGKDVAEEIAACMLGGYGMPAEIGLAAFERLRTRELIYSGVTDAELETALSEPFLGALKGRRYRFPRQKARYLAASLARLPHLDEGSCDASFRDALSCLPGIGLKTASWIVRNRRQSAEVAVLDVHVIRAGRYVGLFDATMNPARHYRNMEARFVELAKALKVRAAHLDSAMWQIMRSIGHLMPNTPYSVHVV